MIELEGKIKKWGNSMGVLLSRKDVTKESLKEGQKVKLMLVKKENPLKKTFGLLKFKRSTNRILQQVDKELWND